MDAIARVSGTDWSKLYIYSFWFFSVIYGSSIVVAIVLDAFMTQWEKEKLPKITDSTQSAPGSSNNLNNIRAISDDELLFFTRGAARGVYDIWKDELMSPQDN